MLKTNFFLNLPTELVVNYCSLECLYSIVWKALFWWSFICPWSNKCNFMQKVVKKMLISKEKYFYFLKDHLYLVFQDAPLLILWHRLLPSDTSLSLSFYLITSSVSLNRSLIRSSLGSASFPHWIGQFSLLQIRESLSNSSSKWFLHLSFVSKYSTLVFKYFDTCLLYWTINS